MKTIDVVISTIVLSLSFMFSANANSWELVNSNNLYHNTTVPVATVGDRYHYYARDIRDTVNGPSISFDCHIDGLTTIDRGFRWYFGKTAFPFNGADVEVDVYIDKELLFTTTGRSTGTYEGSIYPNRFDMLLMRLSMVNGKVLEVIVFNKELGLEEHIAVSLKGVNARHPTIECVAHGLR